MVGMLSLSITNKFYEEVISMDGNILLNVFCAIIWGFVLVGSLCLQFKKEKIEAIYLSLAAIVCLIYYLQQI